MKSKFSRMDVESKIECESDDTIYWHDDDGDLMEFTDYFSEPRIVMSSHFKVLDVYKENGLWYTDVEFADLNGDIKTHEISRYDFAHKREALRMLYLNGMPIPEDEEGLVDYMRRFKPKKKSEGEECPEQ